MESGNAPVLVVMAGATNKGYLVVEANMDGASVYINGVKKPRPVLRGKWQGQLDPGEYTVHLTLNGYDNPADQKLTVVAGKNASAKFTLAQAVTLAFLRIEGGTPEADVFVDGNPIGKLDPTGALAPTGVTPDVDHVIRIEKENYEPFETKRHAPVKEAIRISAPEAQLKQFGALVFEGQPPNAKITIRRRGEAPRDVTEKAVPLRGGAYTVDATADGYEPFQQDEQVGSGQSVTVQIAMNRKAPTPTVTRPKPVDVPDLFDESARWTRQEDGFWIHDGPVWFKELYFTHVFEVLKPKKGFIKQAKVRWVVYAQDDHYIECELDDTTFSTRERIGGKWNPQIKHAHKTGSEAFERV